LLAKLVGERAVTLFLADLEGYELVLHARHRRSKILIKAWTSTIRWKAVLPVGYRAEQFVETVAQCAGKAARLSKGAFRTVLERAGGPRSFEAHGLLAVLREDGREVLLALGDVSIAARRRGERAVLRSWSRSPARSGLAKQFTFWLRAAWSDEDFIHAAGRL